MISHSKFLLFILFCNIFTIDLQAPEAEDFQTLVDDYKQKNPNINLERVEWEHRNGLIKGKDYKIAQEAVRQLYFESHDDEREEYVNMADSQKNSGLLAWFKRQWYRREIYSALKARETKTKPTNNDTESGPPTVAASDIESNLGTEADETTSKAGTVRTVAATGKRLKPDAAEQTKERTPKNIQGEEDKGIADEIHLKIQEQTEKDIKSYPLGVFKYLSTDDLLTLAHKYNNYAELPKELVAALKDKIGRLSEPQLLELQKEIFKAKREAEENNEKNRALLSPFVTELLKPLQERLLSKYPELILPEYIRFIPFDLLEKYIEKLNLSQIVSIISAQFDKVSQAKLSSFQTKLESRLTNIYNNDLNPKLQDEYVQKSIEKYKEFMSLKDNPNIPTMIRVAIEKVITKEFFGSTVLNVMKSKNEDTDDILKNLNNFSEDNLQYLINNKGAQDLVKIRAETILEEHKQAQRQPKTTTIIKKIISKK